MKIMDKQVSFEEMSKSISKFASVFNEVIKGDENKVNFSDFIEKKTCKKPFYKNMNKNNWE